MLATILDTRQPGFGAGLDAWLEARRPGQAAPEVVAKVAGILQDVRSGGDEALRTWTARLDGVDLGAGALEVPVERVWASVEQAPADVVLALEQAHARIEAYHRGLLPGDRHPLGPSGPAYQRCVPLGRVGVYVPGGRAAYPSTVLMNVVPARVAGVEEVIMVSPAPSGEIPEPVLAAAAIAGVDRVFRVGGAQAIAALAFGTESVPPVDKIVGPGNRWVAEAKRQVYGVVGLDMVAGPSEVLVVVDDAVRAQLAAADLLAQAEHDPAAIPILLAPDREVLDRVLEALSEQLESLPRREIAERSLSGAGLGLIAPDRDGWAGICDRIAPEHLELLVDRPEDLAGRIRCAGAVFVGRWSPEALGDYAAGPDHVLPTGGTARFAGPLGPDDFVRRMSVLRFDEGSSRPLMEIVASLARAEGLEGHARSMEIRFRRRSTDGETGEPQIR